MNSELIEMAYKRLITEEVNIINTGFKEFDDILSFCNYGSIITLCGTLNHEFFLNLVKNFSNQNKKCLYLYEEAKHQEFMMKLIVLNSVFAGDLLTSKEEIKKWNIILSDISFDNIDEFKDLVEKEKPDYIFIDNFKKFAVKDTAKDDFIIKLKTLIQEYNAIAFIKTGNVVFEDIDMGIIESPSLKSLSNVIIVTILSKGDDYSFWVLKDNKLNNNVFSLKYEYKNYLFKDIIIEELGESYD